MSTTATRPWQPPRGPYDADPAGTLARLDPVLGRCGITRVADVTGLDRIGIPVWCAIRPNSWSLAVSQGKGATPEQARISAIMEAVELWHAERVALPTRWARPSTVAEGARALDVDRLPDPDPAAHDRRIPWVLGTDLADGEPCWVPRDAVECDDRVQPGLPPAACQGGTNGLAAGPDLTWATHHALCELLERHAVACWERDESEASHRIDLAAVTDPVNRGLLDRFAAAGVVPVLRDLSAAVGLPVVDCLLVEEDQGSLHPLPQVLGTACHPRPEQAVTRALTEAAQVRATVIAGARDSIPRSRYEWYYDPAQRSAVAEELAEPASPGLPVSPVPAEATKAEEVRFLLAAARRAGGGRVAVVDLGKPSIGIPVVKVVAEGLRWAHDLY
ncbi:YcaO-like family protein [Saccharothrix australiensis]|uniref:Ribosomal protein S12 methylthiotransferase accessory factor n=1 Tax=Saccharothrix australiensis TaxID=2072 RepID=A0A495VZ95_9PSEU|nr:YcaO-like family protein [Saccharothrix australiensis]RKT54190.1 ribosomal protein S12 methylthiotransferase accessory factor [Saccharothrix australiensis]